MDCLDGLKQLPDNSVDSVVTDPPYGLSKEPNIVEVLTHWLNDEEYKHPSKGFMGKEWDSFVPSPTIWKEALRVLKPGGHMLCFAGTRTYDLMCMSVRLAGFEIRDMMQWIFGSGFPKSYNISKGIDKKLGYKRPVSETQRPIGGKGGVYEGQGGHWTETVDIPLTPEAEQWDGWGTCLKPANEPIVVARKPISEKTIAENVLKWGTGGINIDECRIPTEDNLNGGRYSDNKGEITCNVYTPAINKRSKSDYNQPTGRFPANIILDEEAGKMLDEQSGILKSGGGNKANIKPLGRKSQVMPTKDTGEIWSQDSGGASRFFYCAKASKRERGEGNNHPTVKPLSLIKYLITLVTPPNGICLDPFEGSGTHVIACRELGFDYIGFEKEEEYYEIANKRTKNWFNED